jgi:hypothetical protein
MALLDTPLDRITEEHLGTLIASGARESLVIDYKRTTYGGADSDHAEFLADVSSFANTLGGDLVIGMDAQKGVPQSLTPVATDVDKELLRLEAMARTGLEPRLPGVSVRAVPVVAGGHVIVIRARRSFGGPHRVVYKNRNRFWARASSGKYEPNVEELRRLFNDLPQMAARLRDFRTDRLVQIAAGNTPSPVGVGAKLVIHIIAVPAFTDGRLTDLIAAVAKSGHVPLPPGNPNGANQEAVNLEVYLNFFSVAGARCRYAQLFRSGAIEGVVDLSIDEDGSSYFLGSDVANKIVGGVEQYLDTLRSLDAGDPIYCFISICNAKGTRMRYRGGDGLYYQTQPFMGDFVSLPETLLDEALDGVPALLRPSLNTLWNAYGFAQCDMYNGQGSWIGTA